MKKFRSILKSIKKFFNPLTWFDTVPISKEIPAPKESQRKTSLKAQHVEKEQILSERIPKPTQTQIFTNSLLRIEDLFDFYGRLFKCEEYRERKTGFREKNPDRT